MYDIPAVVFAGGKSSRMGRDKALLPFGNEESLAAYQYHKLGRFFGQVYLSTKEDKFSFDAPLIYDIAKESSPLVALISAFETLQCDELFVLGVDIPFVGEEIIRRLYAHRDAAHDAVIAKSPQGLQPLCGFYRKSILPTARAHLQEDIHKLQHLLRKADTLALPIESETAFRNLNTPEEYRSALPQSKSREK